MRKGFYPKLAFQGIKKNGKIYIPYILTCIGMVMMYYIICFLSANQSVASMKGGSAVQEMLHYGGFIIAVFAVVFLFYTNSFINRRRKKEFGLYNILGMGKMNIAKILVWETFICFIISIITGLLCGILFSKLAELFVMKMMNVSVNFEFSVDYMSAIKAAAIFAAAFILILLNSLRQVHLSKPIELLHSDEKGEKPPKAHWIFAFAGVIALGIAYYISATIKEPLKALTTFFIAVILVIIATYILFIAGSVVLCRLLQKKKGYYYKPNHFVSVSSMAYRMKRNGASLASICILSTMVLVMISSTLCLYVGKESNLKSQYPREIEISAHIDETSDKNYTKTLNNLISETLNKHNVKLKNEVKYKYLSVGGYLDNGTLDFDRSKYSESQQSDYSKIRNLVVLTLDDYNRLMGENEELGKNEIIISADNDDYKLDTLTIDGLDTMNIVKKDKELIEKDFFDSSLTMMSVYVIVRDDEAFEEINKKQAEIYQKDMSNCMDYYGFDLGCSGEEQVEIFNEIVDGICKIQNENQNFPSFRSNSREEEKDNFYGLFGGLFTLGIFLSIVFLCAAVLIMYYKQISEGYEDCSRFEIMQKVGMTKKQIKKSINSQVLTVFAAPLILSGVHIAFAFPIISKMLRLFGLFDTGLFIGVTIASFAIFALFYIIVYRITSHSYYSIVSGADK